MAAQDFFEYAYRSGAESEFLESATRLSDGRIALVGYQNGDSGTRNAIVYLLDEQGNSLRDGILIGEGATRGRDIVADRDGGFWLVAENSRLNHWSVFHYDRDGEFLGSVAWTRGVGGMTMWSLSVMEDNSLLAVGESGNPSVPIVVRLSPTGGILFSKRIRIPDNMGGVVTEAFSTEAGLLIAGSTGDLQDSTNVNFLGLLDETGNPVWLRSYQTSSGPRLNTGISALQVGTNGTIYWRLEVPVGNLNFHPVVARLTGEGRLIDATRIPREISVLNRGGFLLEGEDRLLIALAESDPFQPRSVSVLRLDFRNAGVERLVLPSTQVNSITTIMPRRNGSGYYLAGRSLGCPAVGSETVVMGVDENMGLGPEGCPAIREFIDRRPIALVAGESWAVGDYDLLVAFPLTPESFAVSQRALTCLLPVNQAPNTVLRSCGTEELSEFLGGEDIPASEAPRSSISVELLDPNDEGALELRAENGLIVVGAGTCRLTISSTMGLLTEEQVADILAGLRYIAPNSATLFRAHPYSLTVLRLCKSPLLLIRSLVVEPVGVTASAPLLIDTLLCEGGQLLLNGHPNGNWTTGESGGSTTITDPGTYAQVTLTGCALDSLIYRVGTRPVGDPLADEAVDLSFCVGDSALFVPTPEENVTFSWLDETATTDRVFGETGTYELVRDNGCATALTTIEVNSFSCCSVYLPNAFSPDGNGLNDRFRPFPSLESCDRATDFELAVFDRWGREVFRGTGTAGWDGSAAGGRLAAAGTYVFVLRYFDGLRTQNRSGSLVLLR